jgi:hypothetical protein
MSGAQRNKLATQGIIAAFGATDEKAVVTAALEAVHERLASDPDLKERVRQKYHEIAALSAETGQNADLGPVPVPIRSGTPEQYTPYGRFDPYKLAWQYGTSQLRAVLLRGTQKDLREATDIVQARNPGTKPASRTKKEDMIAYIMEYVSPLGY